MFEFSQMRQKDIIYLLEAHISWTSCIRNVM